MPVTYVIKFDVVQEKRHLFLDLLSGVLDAMRSEPMFHEAVLHADPVNECRMMLYETWESHDDVVTVQLQRPYRKKWDDALPDILREPRDISIWCPLRTDRADASERRDEPVAAKGAP
jgi:quinol monooxygenase YgiN